MMSYSDNVRATICTAVQTLAAGDGPLKQRLYDAYRDIGVLDPAHLKEEHGELAQDLEGLKNDFTQLPPAEKRPHLGTVYGTLVALEKDEAAHLAQRVVSFYDDVSRACYRQEA